MALLWIVPVSALPTVAGPDGELVLRISLAGQPALRQMVDELRRPGSWGGLYVLPPAETDGTGRLEAIFRARPLIPGLAESFLPAGEGFGLHGVPIAPPQRLSPPVALAPAVRALAGPEAWPTLSRALDDLAPVRLDGLLAPVRRLLELWIGGGRQEGAAGNLARARSIHTAGLGAGTGGGFRTPDIDGVNVALYR